MKIKFLLFSSTSIKHYYYGFQNALFPHSFDVKFTDLKEKIFKIGAPSLPESCMPLGKTADDNETKVVAVGMYYFSKQCHSRPENSKKSRQKNS